MARSDSRRGWRSMTDLVSQRATERPRPAGAPDLPDGDDRLVIGTDGRAVLGAAADDGRDRGPSAGGAAAQAVLADLAGAARVRGRRSDPAAEELLGHLDRAVTELPDAGVPGVARKLQEA